MAELIAVAFDGPDIADQALGELRRLQREYLIDLEDAVVAVRRSNDQVDLKQSVNLLGIGAATGGLWGGLWGSLVGLLFLNPVAGLALGTMVGAGTGALSARLSDYGINDDFIRSVAQTLKPNTSAIFVLVRKVQPEKVLNEVSRFKGTVLRSSLSPEQEARLQAALTSGATAAQPGHN